MVACLGVHVICALIARHFHSFMMYFALYFVSSVIVYVKCSDDGATTHHATTESRFQSRNESKRQIDKTEPKPRQANKF
jgi:hypothetical protein